MIEFKQIEMNDKKWIAPLLDAAGMHGCQYNFTNIFAWANVYNYRVAQLENHLIVKGQDQEETPQYFYPAGSGGNIKSVIEAMTEDAANCNTEFILAGLSKENVEEVNSLFPDKFNFTERRDSFDYVYLLDKLVTLAGRDFSAKRNHINNFKKNNIWSFELITPENLAECWAMNVEWCKTHGCLYNDQLNDENCAVRRCFDYYTELGLEGGLIRSDGKVIAYTMGDKLNSDTYDIHVEKAMEEIQGAYQMINREFAAYILDKNPELLYVDREEDMGQEGLRKSKMSYHPYRLEEKYWGKYE